MNVWTATDWHLWSTDNNNGRHPYRSISNLGRLSDNYAQDIQEGDIFIYLGDLCDPAVTDPRKLKTFLSGIPGTKILCKGNHDTQDDGFYLEAGFDEVCDICKIGSVIFSHKPVKIAPDEVNIHGHLHTRRMSVLGANYINAYDTNYNEHPTLVEDLLEKAPRQDPEEYKQASFNNVAKHPEKYISAVDDTTYAKILDLTTYAESLVGNAAEDSMVQMVIEERAAPTDSTLSRIITFNDWMDKNFQYGLRINGKWDPKRNTSADDYVKYYVMQSPTELEKSKVGVCWDFVSYEAWYFNKNFPDVSYKTYYIMFDNDVDCPSHTILTFTLNGKHYYFECSFRKFAGIYEAADEVNIINYVLQLMSDNPDPSIPKGELLQKWPYDVWEYDALSGKLFGSDCVKYMTYVMDDGKRLHHTYNANQSRVTRCSAITESVDVPDDWPEITSTETEVPGINGRKDLKFTFYNDKSKEVGVADICGTNLDQQYLSYVMVHPRYRGKKYGSAIMHRLMGSWNITNTTVVNGNDVGIHLCKKYGFKKADSFEDYHCTVLDMRTKDYIEESSSILDEILFDDIADTEYWMQDDDYKPSSRKKEPMADGEGDATDESVLASTVDDDHKQTGELRLSQFAQYALTEDRIKKYKPKFPSLCHFYAQDESHTSTIWIDKKDNPVAAVSVSYPEQGDEPGKNQDRWSGHNWITELEIVKDYRGYGLAKQVLNYAVKTLKANALGVADDNLLAQKVYTDYGFKMSKDTSGKNHMMYLHESLQTDWYTPPLINEDSDFHEIDPNAKKALMDKHGLKTPGQYHEYHQTELDTPKETEAEKRVRERREKRAKDLKKARRVKKHNAIKRKIKSKLPKLKNEEVESDPLWGDQERFFEPPNHYASLEESYRFEMLDSVKFFDPVTEDAKPNNRGPLQPVYVILWHTGTALATAIKTVTHSEYSHSSISFDSSMRDMYSFGRKSAGGGKGGAGFAKEDIKSDFYQNRNIHYGIYVIPCFEDEIRNMKRRLDYFIKNSTKFIYDIPGLIKNFFKIEDNPEYSWFCSRFVADILNAGRPDKPYVPKPSLQKPEDFKSATFAHFVEGGDTVKNYNSTNVDKKTRAILRKEGLARKKQEQLESEDGVIAESVIYDVDPFDWFQENVLKYKFAQLDENAFEDFLIYLRTFKVKFDKEGNVIISRREVDQLDTRFHQTVREVKAYQKAGNIEDVKECLAQVYFMIELINKHYLNPKTMQSNRVKSDLKKEMMDLRSVMLNMFQQNLKWVTVREPQFNFKSYYDGSKYGKDTYIPKTVITALGKTVLTALT